ncbi:hypothetical protein MIR68_004751 [Amoeboaphelidium protococcarum]|nr:hypothetical protein MIR68_004751 [Amoeboaphelidium protococcarum]
MNSVSTLFNNLGSKLQKVHFQAKITTESLTDVPLIKGLFFCKFKLKKGNISYRAHSVETASVDQSAVNSISDSTLIPDDKSSMTINNNNDMSVITQSGSKGRTPIMPLKDHAVVWNHTNVFNVILIVRGDNTLQPCEMIISVKKEIAGSKKAETYGKVVIDLAEFAATKFSTRQYLLQDSKSNSTLKISVDMKQIYGEPLFEHDTSISNNSINNNGINQNPFLNVQSQPQTAIPGFNSTESLDSEEYVDYFPCDYGAIYGDKYKQFGSHMDIVQQLYNRVMNPKEHSHHLHDRHKIAVRTSSNPVLTFTTPSPRSQ